MSIETYLSGLGSDLVIKAKEKEAIDRSVDTLMERANGWFGDFYSCLVFGSYTRGTMLPRKADERSDVDVMLVFDDDDDYRPQTYLDRIKRFAMSQYPTSIVHQDRPSVVLDMRHIRIEMTPGKRCGIDGCYNIPFDASEWQVTKPNSFNADLIRCNGNNGYKVKPIIRLMKHWNVCLNYRDMASFELESSLVDSLMYKYISCSSYVDYAIASLEAIRWKTSTSCVDAAIDTVRQAVTDERNGYPYTALDEIKAVFPEV